MCSVNHSPRLSHITERLFAQKIFFRDGQSQTLGVKRDGTVQCSHMNDPVMKNESSPDANVHSQYSLVVYTALALGVALFIRFFIAAPYVVSGASMEPNFQDWNYLLVDRVSYAITQPQRGDVIVFDLPQDQSRALIKRVIGLPGETVVLSGTAPTVTIYNTEHPKGFTIAEPYLSSENFGGATDMRVTLGADQ